LDGALLMRLFKASDAARSAEDEAAAVRLLAIANRSKAPPSHDSAAQARSETPEPPEAEPLQ